MNSRVIDAMILGDRASGDYVSRCGIHRSACMSPMYNWQSRWSWQMHQLSH